MAAPPESPHATDHQEVLDEHGVDALQGLSSEEVARRQEAHGPNELPRHRPPPWWRLLLRQLNSVLMWILIAAIGLSIAIGDTLEALAIAAITIFTVVLGFIQELRAQRAIEALQRMSAPAAHVIRDGQQVSVAARDVVPGDILVLAQGDIVAADARLVESADLRTVEGALTGESMPSEKDHGASVAREAPIGDRTTMVHAATSVARGRGRAVVTATGVATEVGRIGRLLGQVEPAPTPLERQLQRLGRWLLVAGGIVIGLIMAMGLLRGQAWQEMVVFGVALAVAAVPEALPAVVTIGLAVGAQRMARRNALVRRLPTVETLGSTTVVCTDKTGTLTTGEMAVHRIILPDGTFSVDDAPRDAVAALAEAAAHCNDASLDGGGHGDPTEIALLRFAAEQGARPHLARVDEEPFDAATRRMITMHERDGTRIAYAKGAARVILNMCDGQARWLEDAEAAAGDGMRVLAFAVQEAGTYRWLGAIGIRDPPRPEAALAVATCIRAGMRPVLITGDHPGTAQAIAREIGFPESDVHTGPEVEAMDDAALQQAVQETGVYARVSPEHKLRIVAALQQQGHIVAMTGDGVNDAPALRKADIGVAMGITGTDVAKEAAAMTLADDDFATIVAAVEEGRGIFDNIRKYLVYLLSTNLGELVLVAAAMLFGLPLPLTAVMILYVNLASDGLPALALAVDPHDDDVMQRPPRAPGAGILDGRVIGLMVAGGLWTAGATLGVFVYAAQAFPGAEMTMALATLVLLQFTMGFSFRTERRGVWQRPFSNKWYNLAVLWEISLLCALIYVPALQRLFGTSPLPWDAWLWVAAAVISVIPVLEAIKAWSRQ